MVIHEIEAKTILRRQRRIDGWFVSQSGMNLYRGCTHNCIYCDGRAEQYRIQGTFGTDVEVKVNAPALLDRELNPARKRKPFPAGFVMVGGGVCDGYQPIEKKYELSRQALLLLNKYRRPAHVLTKSALVERDLDVLREMNAATGAMVSFSFSTTDPKVARFFEPGLPSPADRLRVMERMKAAGIPSGAFLMPLLPYASDSERAVRQTLTALKNAGADYVVAGTMTLKPGRQKDYYMEKVYGHSEKLGARTAPLYAEENQWGGARADYNAYANTLVARVARELGLARRIPVGLCVNVLDGRHRVLVILQQLDALQAMDGQKSPYGYAAHVLSQRTDAFETMDQAALCRIDGISPAIAGLITEIVSTGTAGCYLDAL